MDPAKQMRLGALLAIASIAFPVVASLTAALLLALGVDRATIQPIQPLIPLVMFVLFVGGVVFAVVGFIRRGRLASEENEGT